MHYYQFNIGDYRKDTIHLSPIEHYIYRTLLDWYYLDEHQIPLETQLVIRRLNITSELLQNLENVLSDFFIKTEKGYKHYRVESEINDYHNMADKNKANGKLGGRPRKTQSVILANPSESQKNPNQEPRTKNQEPLLKAESKALVSKTKTTATASRLPNDWVPSEKEIQFCKTERPDLSVNRIADSFRDYWISVPGAKGRKIDWEATWRNWIRSQRKENIRESESERRRHVMAELTGANKHDYRNEIDITRDCTRVA